MKRTDIAALLVLVATIPAAAAWANSLFSGKARPCIAAGDARYRFSGSVAADLTVRIAGAAPQANLRLQLIDDPNAADFVLVDDSATACSDARATRTIRIDPAARAPDLTVVLSRQPADYKIYVRSAEFTETDAAALFAAIWTDARGAARRRAFAARN